MSRYEDIESMLPRGMAIRMSWFEDGISRVGVSREGKDSWEYPRAILFLDMEPMVPPILGPLNAAWARGRLQVRLSDDRPPTTRISLDLSGLMILEGGRHGS